MVMMEPKTRQEPVNMQKICGPCRRDLTVKVTVEGEERVPVMQLIRSIRMLFGGILGCRQTAPKSYEVAMSNETAKNKLMDGFRINNTQVTAKPLISDEMLVSFLNLPLYTEDAEILEKLMAWGVSPASAIKRRTRPGTNTLDGACFLKVKFTDEVKSLPYSMKFQTANGAHFFRVIHDRQVKVCRICLQPGHILRECPDFLCHKCNQQGHFARECDGDDRKCVVCRLKMDHCIGGEISPTQSDEEQLDGPAQKIEEEEEAPSSDRQQEVLEECFTPISSQTREGTVEPAPTLMMEKIFGPAPGRAKGGESRWDATPGLPGSVLVNTSAALSESGQRAPVEEGGPVTRGHKPMAKKTRLSLSKERGPMCGNIEFSQSERDRSPVKGTVTREWEEDDDPFARTPGASRLKSNRRID